MPDSEAMELVLLREFGCCISVFQWEISTSARVRWITYSRMIQIIDGVAIKLRIEKDRWN